MNKIKITAFTALEFEEIEKLISELPESISSQIEFAELPESISSQIEFAEPSIVGLKCRIRNESKKYQEIYLPSDLIKIVYYEDGDDSYTGIFTPNYFFVLDKHISDNKPTLIIYRDV